MKILKDERVVALNDAISLCLDAAKLYEGLAGTEAGGGLAEALHALAERRRVSAAKLSTEVRRLDELPAAPPQEERVLLESAAAKLKAAFAEQSDERIREEVAAKEAAVRQAAEALGRFELSADGRAAAEELARSAGEGLVR